MPRLLGHRSILAAVGLATGMVAPVISAAGATGIPRPVVTPHSHVIKDLSVSSQSVLGWTGGGGYVVNVNGVKVLSARFVVPALSCTTADDSGVSDEMNGYSIYDGHVYALAAVDEQCNGGSPVYFAQEMNSVLGLTVAAGDSILLRLKNDSVHDWARASVTDLTTGASQSTTVTLYPGDDTGYITSAFVGASPYGSSVADFGTLQWTNISVTGLSLGATDPVRYNWVQADDPQRTLVATTPLTTSGAGFKNVWLNAG